MVNWQRKLFDKLQVHFDGDILLPEFALRFSHAAPRDRIFACVVVVILAPGTSAPAALAGH